MTSLSVLILAGQRSGVVDPLCAEAGVERKAVIPINGRPMIDYVLEGLESAGLTPPFYISGFDADYDARLAQSASDAGPASSALAAIEEGIPMPCLITTCDHPLLDADMLSAFIEGAQKEGVDFCMGLAEKRIIQPAYPDVKRTYLKFRDTSISGCNLFYVANAKGLEALRFWRRAQHLRKNPVKLAGSLGFGILLRYISGGLTVRDTFNHAARKMGITAAPVMIPIAEAAIDVDKPCDRILVEQILTAKAP